MCWLPCTEGMQLNESGFGYLDSVGMSCKSLIAQPPVSNQFFPNTTVVEQPNKDDEKKDDFKFSMEPRKIFLSEAYGKQQSGFTDKHCAEGQFVMNLKAYSTEFMDRPETVRLEWICSDDNSMSISAKDANKGTSKYLDMESSVGFDQVQVASGWYIDFIGVQGKGMEQANGRNVQDVKKSGKCSDGYTPVLAGFRYATGSVFDGLVFSFRCRKN